jgi:hypothetical protein
MTEQVEEPIVESAATPERQAEAEKMGWIPAERFKGDPERFIDAEEYIERGETVLPIVRKENKRLHAEVDGLRTTTRQTEAALKAAQDRLTTIEERHVVEKQRAVAQAKAELKSQLAAANEAGDHGAVADITEQMVELNAQPALTVQRKAEPVAAYVAPPELVAWNAKNPWFGQDKRRTAVAIAAAQELRDGGETATGEAFFEKVGAEVAKTFGEMEPRGDKVEGGRNGSDGDARPGARGSKTYASLPADAKAACESEVRNFVGPGKSYKTKAEWQSRYADIYFTQE